MTNALLLVLSCAAASDALVTPPAALCATPLQPLDPYQAPPPDKQCASPTEMGTSQIEFKMIYPIAPSPKGAVVVFDAAVDDTGALALSDTNDTGALALLDMMFDSRLHLWAWYVRRRFVQTTKQMTKQKTEQKTKQKTGLTPPSPPGFVTGILRVCDAAVHCFTSYVLVPLQILACLLVVAGAVGLYVARKLWRSIVNASGFVAKNKKLAVVSLILVMLPFCGAVRVHGSGNAGPGDAC